VGRTEWRGEKGSWVIATSMEAFAACLAQLVRWHTTVLELSTYQTTELNGIPRPSKDDNVIRRAIISQKSMTEQTRILPASCKRRGILSGLSFPTQVRRSCGSCSLSLHSETATEDGLALTILPSSIPGARLWDDGMLRRWRGFRSFAFEWTKRQRINKSIIGSMLSIGSHLFGI